MGESPYRIGMYVIGGGMLLAWFDPPSGLIRILAIMGLIVLFAYLDAAFFRAKRRPDDPKVVSLGAFRAQRNLTAATGKGGGDRRLLRPVFSTSYYGEVDGLLQLLRAEGLSPMMVTQNRRGESGAAGYKILLPEEDLPRAKPLIDLFLLKFDKKPS